MTFSGVGNFVGWRIEHSQLSITIDKRLLLILRENGRSVRILTLSRLLLTSLSIGVFVWATFWVALPPLNRPSGVDCRGGQEKKVREMKKFKVIRTLFFAQFFGGRFWDSLREQKKRFSTFCLFQEGRVPDALPEMAPIAYIRACRTNQSSVFCCCDIYQQCIDNRVKLLRNMSM